MTIARVWCAYIFIIDYYANNNVSIHEAGKKHRYILRIQLETRGVREGRLLVHLSGETDRLVVDSQRRPRYAITSRWCMQKYATREATEKNQPHDM